MKPFKYSLLCIKVTAIAKRVTTIKKEVITIKKQVTTSRTHCIYKEKLSILYDGKAKSGVGKVKEFSKIESCTQNIARVLEKK